MNIREAIYNVAAALFAKWLWINIGFMLLMLSYVYVGFAYGIVGILVWWSWAYLLIIREGLRRYYVKRQPNDGYRTSEKRRKELMDEAEKERLKTKEKPEYYPQHVG